MSMNRHSKQICRRNFADTCDEQPKVAARESALIVTSVEFPQRRKQSITKSPAPIRRGRQANISDTLKIDPACIVRSKPYILFQP